MQVREGELDAGLITLDRVVKRLSQQQGKATELARAYTYLAIAYVGLAQQETAKAKFIEALRADSHLTLSPQEFPPGIIELFQEARATVGGMAETARREDARPAPATVAAEPSRKKRSKLLPIMLGGVAVAGAGVAVAAASGGTSGEDNKACSGHYVVSAVANSTASGANGWLDVGLDLADIHAGSDGVSVAIAASGRACWGPNPADCQGPEGSPSRRGHWSCSGCPAGSLVAKVVLPGDAATGGPIMCVGAQYSGPSNVPNGRPIRLFLAYCDTDTNFADNSGSFGVDVSTRCQSGGYE